MKPSTKRRIFELDLLRGLFIMIIVIDHLQFWPSPLRYITGEGRLWVSAAEGFFLISGLLIGYIRAYKGRQKPLKDLTKLLAKRAGILYVWGVGVTIFITIITLWIGVNNALLPSLPTPEQLTTPLTFIWSVVTMQYFNPWIYFLRLYAIMLLATPIFLWLLRKGYERMVPIIIITLYCIGFVVDEPSLHWQVLFFGAALFGYYLESIVAWFRRHPRIKITSFVSLIAITIISMMISFFFVLGWDKVEDPSWDIMDRNTYVGLREYIDPHFTSHPFAIGRIILSFTWFGGLLAFMHLAKKYIMKFFGWLLIPIGESSLSAYIIHTLTLPFIVIALSPHNQLFNFCMSLITVLFVWWLIKQKWVKKIVPR